MVSNASIEHNVAEKVSSDGAQFAVALHALQRRYPNLILQIRAKGLLCALELPDDKLVVELTRACLERGLLVTPTRNRVVRLIPSLLINSAEMAAGLALLDSALSSVVQAA